MSSLEQLRRDRDISRAAAAHALNISERHLYRIERGITPARKRYLVALAELYRVSVKRVEQAAKNGAGAPVADGTDSVTGAPA